MKKQNLISSAVASAVCGLSSIVFAGISQAEENDSPGVYALEEIIVTARKHEESLQDAPISITAFSGDGLERRNITALADIGQITPNLVFNPTAPISGSSATASVFIRGVGQNDYTLVTEPGVGIYVDGVYIARSVGGALDLLDVERIEVLRGPQGTLFGRNTIGGAISIISKKPHEELAGKALLTLGDDDLVDFNGKLNVPITDTIMGSVGISSKKRDGYVKNVQTGKELGDDDAQSGRAAIRWLPTDRLSIDISADGTKERENGAAAYAVAADGLSALGAANNVVWLGDLGCAPPPGPLTNTNCFNDQWVLDGKRKTNGTHPQHSKLDIWGVALTVEWELSDNLSLKSITAHRDLDSKFSTDQDHSPVEQDHITHVYDQNQTTQELQLLGNFMDSRLKTVLGLYYFEEEGKDVNTVTFPVVKLHSGGSIDNDSTAIFGQATYDISDAWSATLGLRYTEDNKKFKPDQYVLEGRLTGLPPGFRALPHKEVDNDKNEWTPMVNVAYNMSDATMLYASYSKGYKSGGFDQRVFPPLPAAPSFDPEYVKSYELGLKYNSDDNRFRANGAIFYMDYDDLQIAVLNETIDVVTRNAGDAEIKGFELELAYVPFENWMLESSAGYTDAEYVDLSDDAIRAGISKNHDLVNTPEWSLSGAISYTQLFTSGATLAYRLDGSYRSDVYFDTANTELIAQDDVALANFNLNFQSSGAWSLAAGIDNLSDKDYNVNGFQHLDPFGIAYVNPARERRWWVRAGYEF